MQVCLLSAKQKDKSKLLLLQSLKETNIVVVSVMAMKVLFEPVHRH